MTNVITFSTFTVDTGSVFLLINFLCLRGKLHGLQNDRKCHHVHCTQCLTNTLSITFLLLVIDYIIIIIIITTTTIITNVTTARTKYIGQIAM